MEKSMWLRHYPEGLPESIAIPNLTIIDFLEEAAQSNPDGLAFSHEGQSITFRELKELSQDFASFLSQQKTIQPGDRLLLQLPNGLAFPIIAFGALQAGLIVVSSNPLYTAYEIKKQIQDAKPKVWVTLCQRNQDVPEVCRDSSVSLVIFSDLYDRHPFWKRLGARAYMMSKQKRKTLKLHGISVARALSKGRTKAFQSMKLDPEMTALLQYTGGTTGKWKGAELSHRNIVANVMQFIRFLGATIREDQEIAIAALPVYHIFSFTVHCVAAVKMRSHVIFVHDPTDTQNLIQTMKSSNFTAFAGLNTLFHALCRSREFQELNFQSLRLTIAGGMALNPEIGRKWEEVTGCPVLEGFGMSETSPVLTLNPPHGNQLGTIGIPLPNTDVRLVDDQGQIVHGVNQVGELEVRGPQIMKGYWQQTKETSLHLSADGWLKTGDLAIFLDHGYLKIVGRKKRMIIVSGFNVYPQEVEEVLKQHPQIEGAEVIGMPHRIAGELVRANLTVRGNLDPNEVRRFCRNYLAPYKVPKLIDVKVV